MILSLFPAFLQAQETVVQGKVTDAVTGEPVPYANVVFMGTAIGAATDFDGNYKIATTMPVDSVTASIIGYKTKSKGVRKRETQTVNFQLSEDVATLQEVQILAGENPAFALMRKVVKNKDKNDKRKLSGYEYDSYTKMEIDIDNISEKFRKKKVMRKIAQVLDSIDQIAGEDGKPILPMLITESASKFYYRSNPNLRKELIRKTRVHGVGVEDGALTTQVIGSTFQEYNFYQNWLTILGKEFASPMADGWRIYYEYDLSDSLTLENDYCYRLDFRPRSPQDLAFTGTMWITKKDYALRQIDVKVGKTANLNFIEKIQIQQELQPTNEGPWLPIKNRIVVNISELGKNQAGLLAKFYTSNKNFIVNKPKPTSFFDRRIETLEDAREHEHENWDSIRHEKLSEAENNVYKMIDTIKNIPVVRTYTEVIKTIVDGHYDVGKISFGPYLSYMAINSEEGFRGQVGAKTNHLFSKKWVYSGFLAAGTKDHEIKYRAGIEYILSRKRWTTVSVNTGRDLYRVGVDVSVIFAQPIFLAATRWGTFRRGYYSDDYRFTFNRELFMGFTTKLIARHWSFNPVYEFGFYSPESQGTGKVFDAFKTMEFTAEARYARDEIFIQGRNERISLGGRRWPIISLRYSKGVQGIAGSNFNYDKLHLFITKKIRFGPLGTAFIYINSEYIFNNLPYPLLAVHLGNESPFYSPITYNLMNYGEFVSDHYTSVQWRQYLEGLLLNRIPLLRKLKWRLLATGSMLVGGMREGNQRLIAPLNPEGKPTSLAGHFQPQKPYIELGYGIENIFTVFRVDFVHRLTYLDNPDVRKFGVLVTAQFKL